VPGKRWLFALLPVAAIAIAAAHPLIHPPGSDGALFRVDSDGGEPARLRWPHCPPETFMALGSNDHTVAIVPSRHLVFVRSGWTTGGAHFDDDTPVSHILASLPDES